MLRCECKEEMVGNDVQRKHLRSQRQGKVHPFWVQDRSRETRVRDVLELVRSVKLLQKVSSIRVQWCGRVWYGDSLSRIIMD